MLKELVECNKLAANGAASVGAVRLCVHVFWRSRTEGRRSDFFWWILSKLNLILLVFTISPTAALS